MPDHHEHLHKLAERLRHEQARQGLRQEDIAERSRHVDPKGKGIHLKTVGNVLAGRSVPNRHTRLVIERVLGLPEGFCSKILAGEEPEAPPATDLGALRAIVEHDNRLRAVEEQLRELVQILTAIRKALGTT